MTLQVRNVSIEITFQQEGDIDVPDRYSSESVSTALLPVMTSVVIAVAVCPENALKKPQDQPLVGKYITACFDRSEVY